MLGLDDTVFVYGVFVCSGKVLKEKSDFSCSDPGLGAKVDHVLGPKAGNLDQRANQSPSLIEAPVHALEAGLRSMGNLEAGLVLDLVPPKKMEKVI